MTFKCHCSYLRVPGAGWYITVQVHLMTYTHTLPPPPLSVEADPTQLAIQNDYQKNSSFPSIY